MLLSGANTSYICDSDEGYIAYLREGKGNRVTRIADPGEIDEAILKVSAYCPQGPTGPSGSWARCGERPSTWPPPGPTG